MIVAPGVRVQPMLQADGTYEFLLPDGTKVTRPSLKSTDNVRYLSAEQRVFTRADLSPIQIPFLSINDRHENVIKILKPYLENYRGGLDLGSLLIASTVIRLEDSGCKDYETLSQYHLRLGDHPRVGHMIYNFFRSGVLERDIIPYLHGLMKNYSSHDQIRQNFLIHWNSIIDKGYPTAYFVKQVDGIVSVQTELQWRFDMGVKQVEVYSRSKDRNKSVIGWLDSLKSIMFFEYSVQTYALGATPAVTLNIKRL